MNLLPATTRPKLLDLFCGAGGAGWGYYLAGFDVTGVDLAPQPHYPAALRFVQADALEYVRAHGHEYDAIHASPPCQRYSICTPPEYRENHPDLIAPTRQAVKAMGRPYIIENVENARHLLRRPLMLCSSMFGLPMERHRYFEYAPRFITAHDALRDRMYCRHIYEPVLITGTTRRKSGRLEYNVQQCRDASGIDWMTRKELDEAIPPAYTRWIGAQLMTYLRAQHDTGGGERTTDLRAEREPARVG